MADILGRGKYACLLVSTEKAAGGSTLNFDRQVIFFYSIIYLLKHCVTMIDMLFFQTAWSVAGGVAASVAAVFVCAMCLIAPLHLTMIRSKEKTVLSYKNAIWTKVVLSVSAGNIN
jgi:hypothetical protein